MRIRFSPYQLIGQEGFTNREGALLEFTFEDDTVGYADCHPWEELGDLSLEQQLSFLREGQLTPMTTRSLDFALIDSQARSKKINLFENLELPESHCLIGSDIFPEEFQIYKCKDPRLCLELLPKLPEDKKIRMDFNFKLTKGQFIEFLGRARPYFKSFDFIEDPFAFDPQTWKEFETEYGIPFALDRAKEGEEHTLRVIKPAVDAPRQDETSSRCLFTSYLDHPLGQAAAAYTAAVSGCRNVCGLASHLVYQPNAFSQRFQMNKARLVIPPLGYGFGFDDCLEELHWRHL